VSRTPCAEKANSVEGTDVVNTTAITNNTITNADINSSAAISASKIDTSSATNLVSSIIAGSGVTLSPVSGVGDVTISVSGGGGGGPASDVVCTNCVDSSDITDGTITNADISGSATIAASKIADGSGSGLDADTLDGLNSSAFAASGANSDITSTTALTSVTRATGGPFNLNIGTAAGDDFAVSTDKLVVEGDTGNVGIGDTSPDAKLDVHGTILSGGDGQDGQLQVYSEQGATDYTVTINPNAAMTQNVKLTLPADDGGASQFLQTDGSGNLT